MKIKTKQSGVTLLEMVAVVAAVAVLTLLTIPAIRGLQKSLVSEAATRNLIDTTLATARAMAAQKRCYVGVRFQKAYKHNGEDPGSTENSVLDSTDTLGATQYMIFIMLESDKDLSGNTNDTFNAVEGTKPIPLPDSFTVMDMRIRNKNTNVAGDNPIESDASIDNLIELQDTTTFAIIFSPSGKLVIHELRCKNKDAETTVTNKNTDTIFNIIELVAAVKVDSQYHPNQAMFIEDKYPDIGLAKEYSRRKFVICETDKIKQLFGKTTGATLYNDYLEQLAKNNTIYVNPYTGRLIKNN